MDDYDDIEEFYASRNPTKTVKKVIGDYPDWVETDEHMMFYNAVNVRFKQCQNFIQTIKRGEVEDIKKRDRLLQGTAICQIATLNRKSLTPVKQPEVLKMIQEMNTILEAEFESRKSVIRSDRSQRRPELIKQNKELKKEVRTVIDQCLKDLFQAFQNSEWASDLDSIQLKLKRKEAEILYLSEENANLRCRISSLEEALNRREKSNIKLIKD